VKTKLGLRLGKWLVTRGWILPSSSLPPTLRGVLTNHTQAIQNKDQAQKSKRSQAVSSEAFTILPRDYQGFP